MILILNVAHNNGFMGVPQVINSNQYAADRVSMALRLLLNLNPTQRTTVIFVL